MKNTKIEWADHTFNPWVGCTKVSPACDHCYAESWAKRAGRDVWGPGKPRQRTSDANWRQPIKWNAEAERTGTRARVFCASLADVFDNEVPTDWRTDLFKLIEATPHLDWLLLTKRIGNASAMLDYVTYQLRGSPPIEARWDAEDWPNVWIGATICSQEEADRDVPKLLSVPAAKRFLSIEPMLGALDLVRPKAVRSMCKTCAAGQSRGCTIDQPGPFVDWVIVGGESGPHARPMHPAWARSLRDQCESAGVPFLFKQWGEWLPGENEPHHSGRSVAHHQDGSWGATALRPSIYNYVTWNDADEVHRGSLLDAPPDFKVAAWACRVGKKAAGRLLDGREWNEVPA